MDEVAEAAVITLHVEDEVEQTFGPAAQPRELGLAPEVAQEHEGSRGVVHTGHAFRSFVLRQEPGARSVRVHGDGTGALPGGGKGSREPRELPQDVCRSWRLARISFTEKSAAAMHESAAP